MFANYHTHTYRCHHAYGTEEEYVRFAIERGVKVLGFSDHAPFVLTEGLNLTEKFDSRMTTEEIDGYFDVLFSLRRKYRDRIDIRIGFELEYHPKLVETTVPFLMRYPTEYLILGQHWLWNAIDPTAPAPLTTEEKLDAYADIVVHAIRSGLFRYVAHPEFSLYTPLKTAGSLSPYAERFAPILEAARKADLPIEYNLYGLADGRSYPDDAFWRMAADFGVRAILGCDAHTPERVADPDELEEAGRRLNALGITPIRALDL